MTNPDVTRYTDLRLAAEGHRRAAEARRSHPAELRTRVGWTLVAIGLRLVTPPRTARMA
ncbi:hypothetical protein ACIQNG_07310 [Streptomyces sp. NPDC091377]|uniref:hypothetical protein n=1 Tax=unclassified Streptomyces TaxID=2593676 RepID=UPI00382912CB